MLFRRSLPVAALVCVTLALAFQPDRARSYADLGDASPSPPAAAGFYTPRLLGIYCSDGVYRLAAALSTACVPTPESKQRQQSISREVPPWIDLKDPREILVEDFAPPDRAAKPLGSRKSRPATAVHSIVAGAYGLKAILRSPVHIAVDSRRRLIISDPAAPALQLLDGESTIRIVGGPQHRLLHPEGIALDGDDNIYVADSAVGSVLVYDRDGRFLRYLGETGDERPLQTPIAVAVDPKRGTVYVVDAADGEIVLLDRRGTVLHRIGGRRKLQEVTLDAPTEIAVRGDTLVVLDAFGTRVQRFDLDGNRIGAFRMGVGTGRPVVPEMGLALDGAGNVYVSNGPWRGVRVYAPGGRLLGGFGGDGSAPGAFSGACALALDPAGQLFVADTGNSRVQVFALPESGPGDAAREVSAPRSQ